MYRAIGLHTSGDALLVNTAAAPAGRRWPSRTPTRNRNGARRWHRAGPSDDPIPERKSPAVSNNPQLLPKWYSPAEVAVLLGYGLSKVKNKIATGELRSIKDGKYRRILPEWVDEYVRNLADQQDVA